MANQNKIGFVFAALIGGWHLLWSVLVAVGWAQPVINFIFWAHMIRPIYIIKPFDAVAAGTLIAVTTGAGYVMGYIGTVIWNKLHR